LEESWVDGERRKEYAVTSSRKVDKVTGDSRKTTQESGRQDQLTGAQPIKANQTRSGPNLDTLMQKGSGGGQQQPQQNKTGKVGLKDWETGQERSSQRKPRLKSSQIW